MVRQHDGSFLTLIKLNGDYDPNDRAAAMKFLQEHEAKGEVVTGLIYVDEAASDLHDNLGTVAAPLNALGEKDLCPGATTLAGLNSEYR
jgi:2-oxoglutarate ferredoxin oxidoreductase subunit beta